MIALSATGDAFARGRAQAGAGDAAQVRAATVGRVEAARAEGLLDADALAYLTAQRAFHDRVDPQGMAELAGSAAGWGLAEADLFAHLHLGTLRDIKGGAALIDGCSAWAVPGGPAGPLVVKNRDFSGTHLGIQCTMRHAGPDIATGTILTLGSLGSPAAYSSGVNAAGLAIADTQVAVSRHGVGWLRYFLMPRLLAQCADVAAALALIRSQPHAGGGTLVMADASGATAAVELAAAGPQVQTGGTLWRTNHYTASPDTLAPGCDRIAGNSQARFDDLARRLPAQDWTVAEAQALMATHAGDAPGAAPICQHPHMGDSQTISSVVYSCRLAEMILCEGNPCAGHWQRLPPCR